MTYCVGIHVNGGLVLASDTRTSSSFDDVRVHGKMHVFEKPGECVFVLMSAGNLATTQAVIATLRRDIENPDAAFSLFSAKRLYEVADYIGKVLVANQAQAAENAQQNSVSVEATLILGGQIAGGEAAVRLIYPLGNWISTSPETPYVQIGETKYGKPILERIIDRETTLENAARCALVSFDSTIRSNVSVGLPVDLAFIRDGELRVDRQVRIDEDTEFYTEIRQAWAQKLTEAVYTLPPFPWETTT
ncbi:MAG TPA: 20S proteasome subunit A/B [Dokdonella sp.]|uniref:20S proteasome subunit A/B n=1 Tax=Dokdonella sp. TaxID=2291710 RepID=UPI002D7EDCB6|nr:20S proteasome subunit A/B [Dokdonella sp.]HET9033043.1 20S proteasome subunit A/B [Dokdonella sp.]